MTGRRVLVVGSYPPVPLPEAEATAAVVAELIARGDDVEVLAPRPCAAHHLASFHSWRGSFTLAGLARGFDEVVLRLEPGFPLPSTPSRRRRAVGLASLGLALRAARAAVVQIDDVTVVPHRFQGGLAGVLWGAAGTVVVRSEAERDELVALVGVDGGRVIVEPLPAVRPHAASGTAKLAPGAGRNAVMHVVAHRARLERSRSAELHQVRPPVEPLGPATSVTRALVRRVLERTLGPAAPVVAARARRLVRRGSG